MDPGIHKIQQGRQSHSFLIFTLLLHLIGFLFRVYIYIYIYRRNMKRKQCYHSAKPDWLHNNKLVIINNYFYNKKNLYIYIQ